VFPAAPLAQLQAVREDPLPVRQQLQAVREDPLPVQQQLQDAVEGARLLFCLTLGL